MNDEPQPPPLVPLEVAQRIHQKCEQFEDAWSGPTRPQLDAFLTDVLEPTRSWLLTELMALEVELRRGAGERPTEADYRHSFPGDRCVVAAAFRRCAESTSEREPTPTPVDVEAGAAQTLKPAGPDKATHVHPPRAATGSSTPLPAAPKIEGYEILEVLGRGGMGVVYRARHRRLKRLVALKMILAGAHAGAEQRARFRAEAEMVARLQHPNIAQIFDVGEQDGHPYIAFEFIEGKTLADFAGREPQPARVAAELLEAAARAIHYAHQQGIVHRDLKPANVLVSSGVVSAEWSTQLPGGTNATIHHTPLAAHQLKITDFGLARDLAAPLEHTASGAILGTPLYMSPEQAEGRRDIGPATDIYSLGAILYVLLTGRPPLQGASAIETLKMVISVEPMPPSQLLPHLARDLDTICSKCLHKDPARRYETAGALADDLRRFLHDEPILARPSGRIEKTWRWCRRNPAVAALMASVLLMLVAGVMVSSYFAYTASKEAQDARDEKTRADANAQRARERAYGSDVRLAQRAWEDNLMFLFDELLDRQRPARTDDVDMRGFEWHYWRRLAGAYSIVGRHLDTVHHVCLSPDGKRLASASGQTVKVYDVGAGQEILTLKKGHAGAVSSMCYSPDGKRIALGSIAGEVTVWDAETGQDKLAVKGHADAVLSVCYSPDGKQIVSASKDQTVKVWDVGTGQEALTLTLKGLQIEGASVCFRPNGKAIVSTYRGKTVKVWDIETGKEKLTLEGHTNTVHSVTFSPDGNGLASASEDGTVKLWDIDQAREIRTLGGHTSAVRSVCFSPDGKRVAGGSNDHTVKVWDAETGQEKVTLKGHRLAVTSLCFSPDSKRLASADETVRLWDTFAASEARVRAGHHSQVTCLALSPNGRWLASSGGNWETRASRYSAGELRLWDTASGASPRDLAVHSSGVTCVAFSPDGRYIASGSGVWEEAKHRYTGGEVRLWNPGDGTLLNCLKGHTSSVLCVAFSPDSRFLASAGMAGDVLLRRMSAPLPQGEGVSVEDTLALPRFGTALAFSPDGRFLAGGIDGVVKVWNLTERSEVASLPALGVVFSVAFSPDGKQLAVGSSRDLLLYDTTSYKEVRRLQGHVTLLTHAVYSPDGRRIATASEDGAVKLWDSSGGQEMLSLHGHTGVVRCVEFSPDGHRLYSGGWDKTIRVWDATPLD